MIKFATTSSMGVPTKIIRFKRADFAFEDVGDSTIVINHCDGKLITLNKTASFIWEILKKHVTTQQLVREVKKTYPDAEDKDIKKCLASLKKENMIDFP